MAALNHESKSIDTLGREVLAVQQARRRGEDPQLADRWTEVSPRRTPADLAALVKADLKARFALGDRPAVTEYLDRFPGLRADRDRVVSLVYEEFCLREERGEQLDPDSFCARYENWRDSLASQLQYHRALSQVAGVAPPTPKFPEPGEKFLWFRLNSVLGTGGAGRVYLAVDEELGDREVALKISPDRGGEPSIQGRLDHAHIVPVLSVAREPETGLRGLCMPYRPGRPLDEVTRRVFAASARPRRARDLWRAACPDGENESQSPPGWAGFPIRGTYAEGVAWVVADVAEALAHAHARGVCHRDVKPANVLMTIRGGPQLLDFNLAHDPHAAEQAEAALRGGTLPYMAPEQLEAFLDPSCWTEVGPSADIYALGLLLREMLTGERPDAPDHDLPLPRAVNELLDRRDYAPTPLRKLVPGVPRSLDAIASKCLQPDPKDRYASASDLATDLRLFLEHKPPRHVPVSFDAQTALNWASRHRRQILLSACGATITLTTLTILPPALSMLANSKLDMAVKAAAEKHWDEAERLINQAERFDSREPRIAHVRADVAYKKGDRALTRQLLAKTVADAKSRNDGIQDVTRARVALVDRAAVAIRTGMDLQATGKKDSYIGSQLHFERALEDLALARTSSGLKLDLWNLHRMERQTALAYRGLAAVAQLVDKYPRAIECFERANRATERALTLDPSNVEDRQLAGDIKSSLSTCQQEFDTRKEAIRLIKTWAFRFVRNFDGQFRLASTKTTP